MLFGSQLGHKVLELFVCELGPVVCNERLGHAEAGEHVPFVETQYVVRCNVGKCFGLYPLGEVIDGDDQEFFLVRPLGEWSEDIHAPPSERTRGGHRLELVGRCQVHICVALAFLTFSDVLFCVLLHSGPVVPCS